MLMIDCQATCDACRLLEAEGRWRVQLHTVDDSLERLQPEWDRLLEQSTADLLFQHSAWHRLWWRHFGNEHRLRLITVREGSGRLAALAPLMTAWRNPDEALWFIGGTEVADYLDLIVARAEGHEARIALLEAVRKHIPWRTLDLHCLNEGSETPAAMRTVFLPHGIPVLQEIEDVCPSVALRGSWEGYLAGLSKKDRHELRRKLRRAVDDLGATWQVARTPEDLERSTEAFIQLHRLSGPAKAAFMTEAMAAFFRELASLALQQGWLRLGVLWAGETPLSAAFGFAYKGRFYLYNSGYDPTYAAQSVGVAAVGLLLRDAAEEGLEIFDFLQGNEPYKYTLGGQDHPVYRLVSTREG